MGSRRWWAAGVLGVALAGTVAVVAPAPAQTRSAPAPGLEQADIPVNRRLMNESAAIAGRADAALRRAASLLETMASGDLASFKSQRIVLSAPGAQWPVTLFKASPAKGGPVTATPTGAEVFLGPDEVVEVLQKGTTIVPRTIDGSVLIAVPARDAQVLAMRIPLAYFTEALNGLPRNDGAVRYLVDATGTSLEAKKQPSTADRELIAQLIADGSGYLQGAESQFAVSRVPTTSWNVVVRYPSRGAVTPLLSLDSSFLAGPTYVAAAPLTPASFPKGVLLFPLAGLALLFGMAVLTKRQTWGALEDGTRTFGEHALRIVTSPKRDRRDKESSDIPGRELTAFSADIPTSMPAALGSSDIEFLRNEQVRNLREIWTHTEERLSGQRTWVREEIRKTQESSTASLTEFGSIVNMVQQRLEDARTAWTEVQQTLVSRIDEARNLGADVERIDGRIEALEGAMADIRIDAAMRGERVEAGLSRLDEVLDQLRQVEVLMSDYVLLSARLDEQAARLDSQDAWIRQKGEQLAEHLEHIGQQRIELDGQIETVQTQRRALDDKLVAFNRHEARLGALDERVSAITRALETFNQQVESVGPGGVPGFVNLVRHQIQEVQAIAGEAAAQRAEIDMRMLSAAAEWRQVGNKLADTQRDVAELSKNQAETNRQLASQVEEVGGRLHLFELGASQRFNQIDGRMAHWAELADRVNQLGDHAARHQAFDSSVSQRLTQSEAKLSQLDESSTKSQSLLAGALQRLASSEARLSQLDDLATRTVALETSTHQRLAATEGKLAELNDWIGRTRSLEQLTSKRFEEAHAKLASLSESIGQINGRDTGINQRLAEADGKLSTLAGQVARLEVGTPKLVATEVGALKSRVEGLALANARQQDTLNQAVTSLQALSGETKPGLAGPSLKGRLDELTTVVQQLATQSRMVAEAVDVSTTASSRSEGMLANQVQTLNKRLEDREAALAGLREQQDSLAHRMHMMVQLVSKLSR